MLHESPAAKVASISIIDKDKNTVVGEDTIAIGDKANLRRVGEYVLRIFNKGLTRNCSMYLSEMPTKENKGCYKFGQNADVKAGEGVTVTKDRVRFDSLRLPYCATGHSSQGYDDRGKVLYPRHRCGSHESEVVLDGVDA